MPQRSDLHSAPQGPTPPPDEVHVTLPCAPSHFAEFIAGLLGHPQTISRESESLFVISRDEIESLYYLISQRVIEQNEANLVQFVIVIIYDDLSSIRINSFDDFRHFSEVRPLRSVAVELNWVFLIRFRDRKNVEKQEINIRFSTPQHHHLTQPRYFRRRPILISILAPVDAPQGSIDVQINYTARTWGNDVDNLIKGYTENLAQTEHPVIRFFYDRSHWIGSAIGTIIFLTALLGMYNYMNDLFAWRANQIERYFAEMRTTDELIRDSVKLLLTREFADTHDRFYRILLILSFPIAVTFAFATGVTSKVLAFKLRQDSQILATRQSEIYAQQSHTLFWRNVIAFFSLQVINAAVGILATVISKFIIDG